jgi:hypothetical protein
MLPGIGSGGGILSKPDRTALAEGFPADRGVSRPSQTDLPEAAFMIALRRPS